MTTAPIVTLTLRRLSRIESALARAESRYELAMRAAARIKAGPVSVGTEPGGEPAAKGPEAGSVEEET